MGEMVLRVGEAIAEELRNYGGPIEAEYFDAAIAAIAVMFEWQTIETAPKDGTHFLARYRLVSDEEDEDGHIIRRGVVEHFTVVAYFVFGSFVEFPWRGTFVQNIEWTHWMPLPEPPNEKKD